MGVVTAGERTRVTLIYCMMGGAILVLLARVIYLQLGRHAESHALSARYKSRQEELPGERCRIVDRGGAVLAYDRPVYQAIGEIYFPVDRDTGELDVARRPIERFASDVMLALRQDRAVVPDFAAETRLRALITGQLESKVAKGCARLAERIAATRGSKDPFRPRTVKVDCPLHHEIVDAAALLRLRDLDVRRRKSSRKADRPPYTLYLTLRRRYERVYAEPELLAGVVGRVRDHHDMRGVQKRGISGIERLEIALPAESGAREYLVDARQSSYWSGRGAAPQDTVELTTTLDLELQRVAQESLQLALDRVMERYESPPDWAAIMAVDVPTGDVLAMHSFVQKVGGAPLEHEPFGMFAATEAAFEPGSVVKPLVFAFGLQQGVVDWGRTWDCRSLRLPIEGPRKFRRIVDSHDCFDLTPRGILINSSNIGAVQVGLQLGPDGVQDFLEACRFHEPVDLPLPQPKYRAYPEGRLADLPWNEREIYTVPSLCFGYGMQTTVGHVARAYLTLLTGRPRALRLIDAVRTAEGLSPVARTDADAPVVLGVEARGRVIEALVGMINGEEGATAMPLTTMLTQRGVPKDLIGGKTGTSQCVIRDPRDGTENMVRTASFVGFAPAEKPRVLTICVVQKKDADRFFGGTYAGPAAGTLLLEALERPARHSSARATVRSRVAGVARSQGAPNQKGR